MLVLLGAVLFKAKAVSISGQSGQQSLSKIIIIFCCQFTVLHSRSTLFGTPFAI